MVAVSQKWWENGGLREKMGGVQWAAGKNEWSTVGCGKKGGGGKKLLAEGR